MPLTNRWVGHVVLILTLLAVGVTALQFRDREVRFCRSILAALANGRQGVQRSIAWSQLKAMGVDVGSTYAQLADAKERAKYQQAFIQQFARGFRSSGGDVRAFRRWRLEPSQGNATVVAADYEGKGKTLLFHLSSDGGRKLTGLQWQ